MTNPSRSGRSFKPFKPGEHLFNQIHPDLADRPTGDDDEADALDEWFHLLRRTTARAIMHTVTTVHSNYTNHISNRFEGEPLGYLLALYDVIADLKPGEPQLVVPRTIGVEIQRGIKTFGLVTYPLEPGDRHLWPAASRLVTMVEATWFADAAFRGEWPVPPPHGAPLDQHDPMAALHAITN